MTLVQSTRGGRRNILVALVILVGLCTRIDASNEEKLPKIHAGVIAKLLDTISEICAYHGLAQCVEAVDAFKPQFGLIGSEDPVDNFYTDTDNISAGSANQIVSVAPGAAVWHFIGPRASQEDRFIYHTFEDRNITILAVFDGHGGSDVSDYLAKTFVGVLDQALHPDLALAEYPAALTSAFDTVNAKLLADLPADKLAATGSTATMAVVKRTATDGATVFLANTGDSRSLIYLPGYNGVGAATKDHKPGDYAERARIEKAGGSVTADGDIHRVNGVLATSRAFGDRNLFPCVIHTPEVQGPYYVAPGPDVYILVASDGLFDSLPSDAELYKLLQHMYEMDATAVEVLQTLKRDRERRRIADNVTALVLRIE